MMDVRPLTAADKDWVVAQLRKWWGSVRVVTRGRVHQADELPGFIVVREKERVGLATYRTAGDECEMVTLNSVVEHIGVGSALIEAVKNAGREAGCRRLWLITTNDNMSALRFYQKRQFALVALHRDAISQSRRLKPEIPDTGIDGIPIRDEIELGLML